MVSDWRIVAKALRPIPQQYSGLENKEKRLRKRHLDMLMNSQVYELAQKRSDFWSAIRSFLEDRNFLEVQTPILEKTPGGADARPFSSYHNALDMDVFLRISAGELWQKRLLVAGFEKTFEIGRVFRNEGISPEHAQDFMQMEFYWAYADIADGMSLVKEMYRHIADEVFGTEQFTIGDHKIDLSNDWKQIDYKDTIAQKTNINIDEAETNDLVDHLESHGVSPEKSDSRVRLIDKVWKTVRKDISGPGFLVNIPKELSPLAKENKENSNVVDQFQPIIAGSELGKGYSELNNPTEQAKRFASQEELRAAGDKEAQRNDTDFVEALEYGMPPACGFGIGERLLAFLLDMPIREVQLFPLVRDKT
jgi:lysyl-tRNA synthetase class 2